MKKGQFHILDRLQNSDKGQEAEINLILASGSPRRKNLLTQINLNFKIEVSNVHEDFSIDLAPVDFAEHYANAKAVDVAHKFPESLVVGADTIVVLNEKILGKPRNADESKRMLRDLSGNTHTVITGVSLVLLDNNYTDTFHVSTNVTFNRLTENEIDHYIKNYSPFDKAGSYGIQDWFSVHVSRINGCFYNVVGFPLSRFYTALKNFSGNTGIKLF